MNRRTPKTDSDVDAALEEVRAVYRELEARPIERACERRTECCRFAITGKTPYLTRGEALLVAKAWRATGRTTLPLRDDGACPLLDAAGACNLYADRPFGCRTHYCAAAGGPQARREVLDLIRRLEAVDRALDGDGPIALPSAVSRLLERHGR